MKIIDKNKDYYDYLQYQLKDDKYTFDRRSSYNLSKEEFMESLTGISLTERLAHCGHGDDRQFILQVGANYWFMNLHITGYRYDGPCGYANGYTLELIDHWVDFNKPRVALKLSCITFYFHTLSVGGILNMALVDIHDKKVLKAIKEAVRAYDYKIVTTYDSFSINRNGESEKKTIPILQHIGIPSIIPAEDIYRALEEHFNLLVTESERSESIGLTNKEKIVNHGFDLKTSFRGK